MRSDVLIPVSTLVTGQIILLGIEWLKVRWESDIAARDRRRQALIDLQDALDALITATRADVHQKRKNWAESQAQSKVDDEKVHSDYIETRTRFRSMLGRVPDERARTLAGDSGNATYVVFNTDHYETVTREWTRALRWHEQATERMNELIRELDSQRPNAAVRAWNRLRRAFGRREPSDTTSSP